MQSQTGEMLDNVTEPKRLLAASPDIYIPKAPSPFMNPAFNLASTALRGLLVLVLVLVLMLVLLLVLVLVLVVVVVVVVVASVIPSCERCCWCSDSGNRR
jgi:uncharacterized membrane protein